ncbi:uncharacterized protein VTP21DRAFT_774 [Calcarisporiella thermophila]|uniref:uncharacterized protein n=1 Tax=Calcarisporiella thermophila TaxID=911321 RepID=UPI003744951D
MRFQQYIAEFSDAVAEENEYDLARLLQLNPRLQPDVMPPKNVVIKECRARVPSPWDEVVYHHLEVLPALDRGNFIDAYAEQSQVVQHFLRVLVNLSRNSLQALYSVCLDLQQLAIKADEVLVSNGKSAAKLEDAARYINKAFTACITDRANSLPVSRKWGTYRIINILFNIYFKLKSTNLCKNVLRAVRVSHLPPLSEFPKSHQVTYKYYLGILHFYNEEYDKAEENLMYSFLYCHKKYRNNKELILHYLIPVLLLRGVLPTSHLLNSYPNLANIYTPFLAAIRTGNVKAFDDALYRAERPLVQRGTYLTVERARSVVIRTLFKKVFNIMGREHKLPLSYFRNALECVGMKTEMPEVECMLANMIYKGYIRGYLSHEASFMVLSQKNPFPSFESLNAAAASTPAAASN